MSEEITVGNDEQINEDTVNDTGNASAIEGPFYCEHRGHWIPRSQAYYPHSKDPSICKECAKERKAQNRQRQQAELAKQKVAVSQIPDPSDRGGAKRSTLSLSRYALTTLDVLAVGSSTSEVADRAIMAYLEGQDAEAIAFVGRMFATMTN